MSSARAVYRQYSGSSNLGSSENLPPRTLARLAREVQALHKNPPEGVRLVVDEETGLPSNLGEIMAEMEGPTGTPYEGKFFLLKLIFSQEFPAAPPRGFFLTKLYHPNIDPATGAICVNTLKKDWTPETTISHVLAVIRCLMIVPFPESSLNDEAGKLFMESYEEFYKRAKLMADVHGRAISCQAKATGTNGSSTGTSGSSPSNNNNTEPEKKEDRVLKSSSDNPLRTSGNAKKVNKSAASGKMAKKKSLKRL